MDRGFRGNVIVELAAGAFLFVIFALLAFDAGVLIMANSVLDEASRDAARAAGECDSQAKAQQAALAAVAKHKDPNNPFLKTVNLVGEVDYQPVVAKIDSTNGTTGGLMDGTPFVRLTVGIDARIPAPIFFFNAKFGADGSLHFESTTTFPIIKLPVSATGDLFDKQPVTTGGAGGQAVPCPPSQSPCPPPQGGPGPGPGSGPGPGPTTTGGGGAPPG